MEHQKIQRIAAYALIIAENHVLLSLLNRGPSRGKWTLIGGQIEFGESPRAALVREVREEAGIEIQETDAHLIEVLSYQADFQDVPDVTKSIHFLGIVHTIDFPQMLACKAEPDGHSSDGTRWFNLADLDQNTLNPSAQKILEWHLTKR
jgi:8-oxo-dGTP diphosphatase